MEQVTMIKTLQNENTKLSEQNQNQQREINQLKKSLKSEDQRIDAIENEVC